MWWFMSKYVIRLNRVWDSGFSLSLAFSLSKCRCDITTLRFFHLRCNHHFIAGPLFFSLMFLYHRLTQKCRIQNISEVKLGMLTYRRLIIYVLCSCTCSNTTVNINHMCYIFLRHYSSFHVPPHTGQ